jgi:AraC family transcriptional regulator of adaptative response/methylated-DNA-[protein]-cysteine methyltransferase
MHTSDQYQLIARAIRWVADHQSDQPDLELLADAMGTSPFHLQRIFQEWAGVTPKQFLKSLTRRAALQRLLDGSTVLDAALSAGLSGPGRLHDLMLTTEALTPGEIRQRAAGVDLEFGTGETPFGQALVCWSPRGLNFLGFCEETRPGDALAELRGRWTNATFTENTDGAQAWLQEVFSASHAQPLRLWLRGSAFQLKVWEALLDIPEGAHASYGSLARYIGQPAAARAVGSAVGANPLAWIIPCHRVIRQVGELGGYRWGPVTKHAMIGYEATRRLVSGERALAGEVHVNP